jgi:hypothetical protein
MRMMIFSPCRRRSAAITLPALALLAACGGGGNTPRTADAAEPARTPTQYVVAVDLSTSLTSTERANHEALLHSLVATLDYGDQLVLLKAHEAGVKADTSTVRTVSMPVPRGPRPLQREKDALAMQRQTADLAVTRLFENAPTHGSDLFATMHSAGERAGEGAGKRKVLLVLSDMLQCTSGSICMERTDGVPDSGWVARQKEASLIPSLDSVCVSVVGAVASTPQGVKVREFWSSWFQQAGANFSPDRYVHSASTPAGLRCTG